MRRNSVFFACTTVLPFMSGSSWSAVIIHGLNSIVPRVRHAMGLEVAPAKAATAAEMVVILSQQDENASYDVAYINGIYGILATTFAYVHMKGRGARKNTFAVERIFRRVLPVVVRRLPYPTKSFRAGENIISYLAFYMSAHPTGAARQRSTDKLWTQSAPLAEARQAVRDFATAQRRRDDAVENNVAAVLLCGANLHGENSTSGDDDASGGTRHHRQTRTAAVTPAAALCGTAAVAPPRRGQTAATSWGAKVAVKEVAVPVRRPRRAPATSARKWLVTRHNVERE